MNIAIAFCGEGFGHASRISAIASELKKYHNLTFWCPVEVQAFFKKNYPEAEPYSVPLLSIVKKHNKIQLFPTMKVNAQSILLSKKIVSDLAKKLLELKIEAVISDYEPFLAKAAKKIGIPLLLFNHPGIITRFSKFHTSYFLSSFTAKVMMPYYKENNLIISSFYHGDVGPIIRNELKQIKTKKEDFILVYLKTSLKDKILPVLEKLQEVNFKYFPNHEDDFISALASCKGVIAPAGHQLISECLYLKKPILVIPESRQYEQLLNAQMLLKTGLGDMIDEKNMKESIINFIHKTEIGFFSKNNKLENFILTDDLENAVNKINLFLLNANVKANNTLLNSKENNANNINLKRKLYERK